MAQQIKHKEAYRIFWLVKGHLDVTERTARSCYDGYFRRCWHDEESYKYEEGFEEAYNKKFGPTGLN